MKITLHLDSEPSKLKTISYFLDLSETVEHVKSQLHSDIPNQFKTLYFKNAELIDKRSLISYNIGKDSLLDLFIEDEITINFHSRIHKPIEMLVETHKPHTYKSLIKEFKTKNKIQGKIALQGNLSVAEEEEELIWDKGIMNGTVLNFELIETNVNAKEKINSESNLRKKKTPKRKCSIENQEEEKKIKPQHEEMKYEHPQAEIKKKCFSNFKANDAVLNKFISLINKTIEPLVSQKKKPRYLKLIEKLREEKVTILVTGFVSAGKTTFINQLISYLKKNGEGSHEEFLPTDWMENTGFFWILTKSQNDKIIVSVQNETYTFDPAENLKFQQKLSELNQQQKQFFSPIHQSLDSIKEFPIITVKFPFFLEGLTIIDCPGYSRKEIFENIKQFIDSRILHIFIIKSLENSVHNDEYFEPFIKEVKRIYNKINVFLCFTQKDVFREKSAIVEKEITEIIKLASEHIFILGKYDVSPKRIYLLNSKDRLENYSMGRMMDDLKGLLKNYLAYNIRYSLSDCANLFEDEEAKKNPGNMKKNNPENYPRISEIREKIVKKFKKDLNKFFSPLLNEEGEEWRYWKRKVGKYKKLQNKTKFMNKIIKKMHKKLTDYLMSHVKEMCAASIKQFLQEMVTLLGRNQVSDNLCLSSDHLERILTKNYEYDRKVFMCLSLDLDYSNLERFQRLENFYHKIVSIGFWFEEKGLWLSKSAYNDLVLHFCKIFGLQQKMMQNDTATLLDITLLDHSEKIATSKIFEENYQFAKKNINDLETELEKDLPIHAKNKRKELDLDLLDFKDLDLRNGEDYLENFQEEKNNWVKKMLDVGQT